MCLARNLEHKVWQQRGASHGHLYTNSNQACSNLIDEWMKARELAGLSS
jgi:hypothetical protein